jgi:CRISPR-associated protein Cas5t
MLLLYVEAPFAAFRTFTAGWYRPTATFLTPSAAYGVLLNVAGIESRLPEGKAGHDGKVPATLLKPVKSQWQDGSGLPPAELAVGVPEFRLRRGQVVPDECGSPFPIVQTILQQLHNYPVGASGAGRAESTRGNKYNIQPVRREFLSDLRAVIAVRGNDELADRVRRGLAGEFNAERYGIPFLGDNSFLLDRLEELPNSGPVRWLERITAEAAAGMRPRTCRMTVFIDRADLSRTASALFAPQSDAMADAPPDLAWNSIAPSDDQRAGPEGQATKNA